MKNILDFSCQELKNELKDMGLPGFRYKQIYEWLTRYADFEEMSNIPIALRQKLAAEYTAKPVTIIKELKAKDGTQKFLFRMQDGNIVEGVLMSYKYGNTLCLSSQIGCRMGCSFCASGEGGLVRNLTSGEMLGEVLAINRHLGGDKENRKITNLVLMGSGEPLDNYDNVVKFIKIITSEDSLNISERNISLSTCGMAPNILRLADEGLAITLAISLHATTDEERKKTMKVTKAYSISKIIKSAKEYFDKTGRRVYFEYILLKGNTTKEDAERLKKLLSGIVAHVNLIPLNSTLYGKSQQITKKQGYEFCDELNKLGVSATVRRTLGEDIEGACGQLRAKFLADPIKIKKQEK